MRPELSMTYLETVYQMYQKTSKESKGKISDELCKVCKCNRKYVIWKLRGMLIEDKPKARLKRKRSRKYSYQVLKALEKIWEAANYPWSLRLREIIHLWLPWIRARYHVGPEVEKKLLSISPSTMDRALRDKKRKLKRRLCGRTKPGTLLPDLF